MRLMLLIISFLLTCFSFLAPINEYGPGIYDHDTEGELISSLSVAASILLNCLCLIASYIQKKNDRQPIVLFLCLIVVLINVFQTVRLYNYYAEQKLLAYSTELLLIFHMQ